jgi:hypothetical protein
MLVLAIYQLGQLNAKRRLAIGADLFRLFTQLTPIMDMFWFVLRCECDVDGILWLYSMIKDCCRY